MYKCLKNALLNNAFLNIISNLYWCFIILTFVRPLLWRSHHHDDPGSGQEVQAGRGAGRLVVPHEGWIFDSRTTNHVCQHREFHEQAEHQQDENIPVGLWYWKQENDLHQGICSSKPYWCSTNLQRWNYQEDYWDAVWHWSNIGSGS